MKSKLEQWREVREAVQNLNRTLDTVALQLGKSPQTSQEIADLFAQMFKKKTHAAS